MKKTEFEEYKRNVPEHLQKLFGLGIFEIMSEINLKQANPEEAKKKIMSLSERILKRELTSEEIANVFFGILKNLSSDPATKEREISIRYLTELEFLNEQDPQKQEMEMLKMVKKFKEKMFIRYSL